MYLATEASEIRIPSLRSSLWILGAPQVELFRLRIRISSRVSLGTLGRPACPCRTFQVQYQRNPRRCQPITVAGFTIRSADRHRGSIETTINVDRPVSIWVWESFVAAHRSDVEALDFCWFQDGVLGSSVIGCRDASGSGSIFKGR